MTYIYYLEQNGTPFYIGKCKNSTRRRHRHYRTYGTNIKLNIIDETTDNKKDWKFWEGFYINLFKSWGFKLENKNNGGGGPSFYSEEQKQKMRGRKLSKKTKDKISKTLKERNHSKYYTDEVKEKMSKIMSGRHVEFSKEHIDNIKKSRRKTSKRVIQYDLQGNKIKEWLSKGEAAEDIIKKTGKTSNVTSQIKDCCLGRCKTSFGFIWRYKGDIRELNSFNIIYQFDKNKNLINRFKSMIELRNWLKLNRSNSAIDTITYTINKKSSNRTYKSGGYYYSRKNKI